MFEWVGNFLAAIKSTLFNIFEAAKTWLVDVIFAVADGVLLAVEALAAAVPVPAAWAGSGSIWSGLPGQFFYIASQLQLPACMAIIAAAYGVRFLLNLIPAALTRV